MVPVVPSVPVLPVVPMVPVVPSVPVLPVVPMVPVVPVVFVSQQQCARCSASLSAQVVVGIYQYSCSCARFKENTNNKGCCVNTAERRHWSLQLAEIIHCG